MTRAILDASETGRFTAPIGPSDLQPLDEGLASQLPTWDLVPPHTFLVRRPRKPKPVDAPSISSRVEPMGAIADVAAPAAAPLAEPEPELAPRIEVHEPLPVSEYGSGVEPEIISPVADEGRCANCRSPLEPRSSFCTECGTKQP